MRLAFWRGMSGRVLRREVSFGGGASLSRVRSSRKPGRRGGRPPAGEGGLSVDRDYRWVTVRFPPRVKKSLDRFCRKHGVTMYKVLWQGFEELERLVSSGEVELRRE